MIQLIFLFVFYLLSSCQSKGTPTPSILSINPTIAPTNTIRSISIFGYFPKYNYIDNQNIAYSCNFILSPTQKIPVQSTYISSDHIICKTPIIQSPQNIRIQVGIAECQNNIPTTWRYIISLQSPTLQFMNPDNCYQPLSTCKVWGDPHFVPFCGGGEGKDWIMQAGDSTINLVTSKDGRFVVYGRTTGVWINYVAPPDVGIVLAPEEWWLKNYGVSNLNGVSVIGSGLDGRMSKITMDSAVLKTMKLYLGTRELDLAGMPYNFNGITISSPGSEFVNLNGLSLNYRKITVKFPGGEIVDWNGFDSVNIWLPGAQYWKNVVGLCGQLDETVPYCTGNNGNTYNYTKREDCATSWILKGQGLKRSIAEDSNIDDLLNVTVLDNSTFFYENVTIIETPVEYENITSNSTSFVVSDNLLTKAAKNICVFMFEILSELCPANYSQNLPFYETSCIYDGSAFLTYKFQKISPSTDIDSLTDLIDNVKNFFSNLRILGETILDEDTFTFMVSSVQAGLQDCFYRNLTNNATESEFDVDAFYSSLPGCSSYCVFPGASCSGDECQMTMTLDELITLVDSGSSIIQMNVIVFIGSFVLSIW